MDNDLVRIPVQSFPADEPIDPYGNKKGNLSWQQVGRRISQMTPKQLLDQYGVVLTTLTEIGNEEKLSSATLRELAMLAAYIEVIRHPNPSMLGLLQDREDGKVATTVASVTGNVTDWMEYARENNIEIDAVMEEAKRLMDEYNKPPKVVEGEIVDS